jgi:hypothetical protein
MMSGEQVSRNGDLSHLERNIAPVAFTTFAPFLMSFALRLVSDQSSARAWRACAGSCREYRTTNRLFMAATFFCLAALKTPHFVNPCALRFEVAVHI